MKKKTKIDESNNQKIMYLLNDRFLFRESFIDHKYPDKINDLDDLLIDKISKGRITNEAFYEITKMRSDILQALKSYNYNKQYILEEEIINKIKPILKNILILEKRIKTSFSRKRVNKT